jgi:serine/threonine protein kinase
MGCPSEQTFVAIVEGGLNDGARAAFYEHVESCSLCGQLLNAFARSYAADSPSSALKPGQLVGQYRLEQQIGAGGMGVVFRAVDTQLNRTVALKFMSAAHAGSAHATLRLLREARAAGALDHPNIGAVFDVGEHHGRPFIVMSFYDGETLKQRLEGGRMARDEAVGILAQIANALDAAHSAGILHRDVKPANVILTASGAVKVVDFGLAKTLATAEGETLTATGEMIGTLAYMAPEQLRGQASDMRADVWALGVVAFEMLAGRRPFDGPASSVMLAALHDEVSLKRAGVRVPVDLETIVLRCLDKDPARRYPSAGAVADGAAPVFSARADCRAPRRRGRLDGTQGAQASRADRGHPRGDRAPGGHLDGVGAAHRARACAGHRARRRAGAGAGARDTRPRSDRVAGVAQDADQLLALLALGAHDRRGRAPARRGTRAQRAHRRDRPRRLLARWEEGGVGER